MAAMNFSLVSLRPPEFSTPATTKLPKIVQFLPKKSPIFVSFASSSSESSTATPEKPQIELEFLGVILFDNSII